MKELISKIFAPPNQVIIITDIIAIPLTVIALGFLKDSNPICYVAYLLSTYALIVSIVGIKRLAAHISALYRSDKLPIAARFKTIMRKNKFTGRYLDDRDFRAEVSLYASLAINVLYGVFKGASGAYYRSAWLISIGAYYLALSSIRFMLMRSVRADRRSVSADEAKLHEYKTYRLCGSMMMALDLAVTAMSLQMIFENKTYQYSKTVVIISAAYTFYSFISAITNAIAFRKRSSMILSAAKNLNLSGAVMSMFTLQAAMIYAFDDSGGSFAMTANSITGGFVFFIILGIATYMIIYGTKMINYYNQSPAQTDEKPR